MSNTPYLTAMIYPLDMTVDRFINDLLDMEPLVVSVNNAYATFMVKNVYISIWITNKWYAYAGRATNTTEKKGELQSLGKKLWEERRPKRRTMVRLQRYIDANYTPPNTEPVLELTAIIANSNKE